MNQGVGRAVPDGPRSVWMVHAQMQNSPRGLKSTALDQIVRFGRPTSKHSCYQAVHATNLGREFSDLRAALPSGSAFLLLRKEPKRHIINRYLLTNVSLVDLQILPCIFKQSKVCICELYSGIIWGSTSETFVIYRLRIFSNNLKVASFFHIIRSLLRYW